MSDKRKIENDYDERKDLLFELMISPSLSRPAANLTRHKANLGTRYVYLKYV